MTTNSDCYCHLHSVRHCDMCFGHADRLLRRRDVESLVGLSRTNIYKKMSEGAFPRPKPLGKGAVRWLQSEIDAWIQQLSSA